MTYDPDSGVFGDDSIGNGLFDSSLPNPWELSTDEPEDDEHYVGQSVTVAAGDNPVGGIGITAYDRGDNLIVQGPIEMDRDNVTRKGRGPTKLERIAQQRREERTATDTGNRNIGRAAGQHSGSSIAGLGGGGGGTASSIEEAADRLQQSLGGVTDPGRLDDRVKAFIAKTLNNPRDSRAGEFPEPKPTRPPGFDTAKFECTINKIATNTQGDWLVTIKIPFEHRAEVRELDGGFGMAIETVMTRKNSDATD
jgi:hypothetical protein